MKYKNYGKNPSESYLSLGRGSKPKADEYDDEGDNNLRCGLYVKRLSVLDIDFQLNTSIQSPHMYNDLFQVLINADKDDNVRMWIDSGGGQIGTTMRILAALRDTEANVTVIGCGMAASAAGMLFLRSDNVIVTPEMQMMCHACNYLSGGKQGEIFEDVMFRNEHLTQLLRETYEGFLTESEITQMLIGKDFYFCADEIIQRLEVRELFWQEQDKQQEASKQVVKPPKPKPAVKAASKKK